LATSFIASATPTEWFASGCANGSACAPVFSIGIGSFSNTMYYFTGGNQFFTSLTTAVTPTTTPVINLLPSTPVSMWATSSTIYWATATSIFAQSTATGQTAGAAKATNGSGISRIAHDGTSLFALDVAGSAIRKYDSNGGFVSNLATGVAATTNLLAFDLSSIFWADNSSPTKLRRTSH
jgi:carbohydrate-selective porin OprB